MTQDLYLHWTSGVGGIHVDSSGTAIIPKLHATDISGIDVEVSGIHIYATQGDFTSGITAQTISAAVVRAVQFDNISGVPYATNALHSASSDFATAAFTVTSGTYATSGDYATHGEISSVVLTRAMSGDYATTSDISGMAHLADTSGIGVHAASADFALTAYTVSSGATVDFSGVVYDADISGMAHVGDISGFATLVDLDTYQVSGEYLVAQDISGVTHVADISGMAHVGDISGYAELTDLDSYQLSGEYLVAQDISGVVHVADLDAYQVSGEYLVSVDISGYALLDSFSGELQTLRVSSSGSLTLHAESGVYISSVLYAANAELPEYQTSGEYATLVDAYAAASGAITNCVMSGQESGYVSGDTAYLGALTCGDFSPGHLYTCTESTQSFYISGLGITADRAVRIEFQLNTYIGTSADRYYMTFNGNKVTQGFAMFGNPNTSGMGGTYNLIAFDMAINDPTTLASGGIIAGEGMVGLGRVDGQMGYPTRMLPYMRGNWVYGPTLWNVFTFVNGMSWTHTSTGSVNAIGVITGSDCSLQSGSYIRVWA